MTCPDEFWTIPIGKRGRPAGAAQAIPLTGDFTFVTTGDFPINLNGITATRNGTAPLAVHTALGVLYRIDPTTGEATEIDLGRDLVPRRRADVDRLRRRARFHLARPAGHYAVAWGSHTRRVAHFAYAV